MIILDDFSGTWQAGVWNHVIFVVPAPAPDPGEMVWLLVAPASVLVEPGIISVGAKTGCSDRRYMRMCPSS